MRILTPCVIPLVPQLQPQPLRGKTSFRRFGLDALAHSLSTAEPMPNLSEQESTVEQTSSSLLACLTCVLGVLGVADVNPRPTKPMFARL